mmetsp:Transcript_16125/g.40430  ORF Transcript_16125/g.40430 Transcript_16125/m.40430 type:complete len:355 (-) Transcript_16125:60-1124(-)
MVPFEASGIFLEGLKVLCLQRSRAARLVAVSLFEVKSVKVVGASEFGIHKDSLQNVLVEFVGVKFWTNLVWRDTKEGRNNAGEELAGPPGSIVDKVVVASDVVMRKSLFGPFLKVESQKEHQKGNEELGAESGRSGGVKSLAEDSLDAAIPPLASGSRHGVAHSLPDLEGNRHIRVTPDAPPLVVCQFGVVEHADLELKEPELVLVHVADDNLGGSLDGIIQDNVTGRTNSEDDIIFGNFQDLVVDGRILPANVVNVGAVADGINHVEGFPDNHASQIQTYHGSSGNGEVGFLVGLHHSGAHLLRCLGELGHGFDCRGAQSIQHLVHGRLVENHHLVVYFYRAMLKLGKNKLCG